jgi:hypothetical protein
MKKKKSMPKKKIMNQKKMVKKKKKKIHQPIRSTGPWLREIVFPDIDRELEVVSVIVTHFHGSSYDNLFRSVCQKVPEGRVSLYKVERHGIPELLKIMKDLPVKERMIEEEKEEEETEGEKEKEKPDEVEEKKEDEKPKEEEEKKDEAPPKEKKEKPTGPPKEVEVHSDQLIEEILDIDPDCVLFNWECCGGKYFAIICCNHLTLKNRMF